MFHEAVDHVLSFLGSSPYDVGYSSVEVGDFIDRDVIPYFGFAPNDVLRTSILRIVVDRHYKEMIIKLHDAGENTNSMFSYSSASETNATQLVQGRMKSKKMNRKEPGNSSYDAILGDPAGDCQRSRSFAGSTQGALKNNDAGDINSSSALSKSEVLKLLDTSQVETNSHDRRFFSRDGYKSSSGETKTLKVLHFFPQLPLTERVFGVELRTKREQEGARFACLHAVEGIDPSGRREFEGNDSRRACVSAAITQFLKHHILKPVFLFDSCEVTLRKRYFPFFAFPKSSVISHREKTSVDHIKFEDGNNFLFSGDECMGEEHFSCLSPLDHYFERCRDERRRSRSFPDIVLNLGLAKGVVICSPERQLLLQEAVEAILKAHGGPTASFRWDQLSRFVKVQCEQMLEAAGLVVVPAQLVLRGFVRRLKLVMPSEDGGIRSHEKRNISSLLSSGRNPRMINRVKREEDEDENDPKNDENSDGSDDEIDNRSEERNVDDNDAEEEGEEADFEKKNQKGETFGWPDSVFSPFQEQLIRAARAPIYYTPSFPVVLQLVQQTEHRPVTVVGALPSVRFYDHRHRYRVISDSLQRYYELNVDRIGRINAILHQSSKTFSIIYYPRSMERQYDGLEGSKQVRSSSITETKEDGGSSITFSSSMSSTTPTSLSYPPKSVDAGALTDPMRYSPTIDAVLPPGVSAYGMITIMEALRQAPHHAVALQTLYDRIASKSIKRRLIPYLLETKQIVTSGYSGSFCTQRIGIVALASVKLTEELKATVVREWREETARRHASLELPSIEKLPSLTSVDEVSKARHRLDKRASRGATLLVNRLLMSRNGYARNSCQRAGRLHLELWWQWYSRYDRLTGRSSRGDNDGSLDREMEKRKESLDEGNENRKNTRKRLREEMPGSAWTRARAMEEDNNEGCSSEEHRHHPDLNYSSHSFPSETFIPLHQVLANMSLSSFCILVGIPRIDLDAFPTLHQCQHGGPVYDHVTPNVDQVLQWDTRLADLPSSVQRWCRIQGYFTFLSAVKELLERKLIRVRRVSRQRPGLTSPTFVSFEENMSFHPDEALPLALSVHDQEGDAPSPSNAAVRRDLTSTSLSDSSQITYSYSDVSSSALFSVPISSLEVCLLHEGRLGATRFCFFGEESAHGVDCSLPGSTTQAVLWYWAQVWRQLAIHRALLLSCSQDHIPWNTLVSNLTLARSLALAKYYRYDVGVLGELLFQRCGQRVPQVRLAVSRGLRDVCLNETQQKSPHKKGKRSVSLREDGKKAKHRGSAISSPVIRVELVGMNVANAVYSALRTHTPFFHLDRVVKTVLRMRISHVRAHSQMSVTFPSYTTAAVTGVSTDGNHLMRNAVAQHSVPVLSVSSSSPFSSQIIPSLMCYNRYQSPVVLHLSYLCKVVEERLQSSWHCTAFHDLLRDGGKVGGLQTVSPSFAPPDYVKDRESFCPPAHISGVEDEQAFSPAFSDSTGACRSRAAATTQRFSRLCSSVNQALSPSVDVHRAEDNPWNEGKQNEGMKVLPLSSLPSVPPLPSSLPSPSSVSQNEVKQTEVSTICPPLLQERTALPSSETPHFTNTTTVTAPPCQSKGEPLLSPALFEVLVDSMRCILLSDQSHYNLRTAQELILAFPPGEVARARRYLLSFSAFIKGSRRDRLPFLTFSVVRSLLPQGLCRQFARPCTNAELLTSWALSLEATSSVLGGMPAHPMIPLLSRRTSSLFPHNAVPPSFSLHQADKEIEKCTENGLGNTHEEKELFGGPDDEGMTPLSLSLSEPIHLEASHLLQSEKTLSSLPLPRFRFPPAAFSLDGRCRVENKHERKRSVKLHSRRDASNRNRHDDDDEDEDTDDHVADPQQERLVNKLYPARRLQSAVESHHQKLIPLFSTVPEDGVQEGAERKRSSGMWLGRVPRYRRARQATEIIPMDPLPTDSEISNVKQAIASIKERKVPRKVVGVEYERRLNSVESRQPSSLSHAYPLPYPSIFHHVDGSFHSYMWQIFISTLLRYINHVPGIDYNHLKSTIMSSGIISERSLEAGLTFLLDNRDIVVRKPYRTEEEDEDGEEDTYTLICRDRGVESSGITGKSPFACGRELRRKQRKLSPRPSEDVMQGKPAFRGKENTEQEIQYCTKKWKNCTFFSCIHQGDMFQFD